MNYSILLDIILIAIGVAIIFVCFKKGFVAAVAQLVGTAASYVFAYIISAPISVMIYKLFVRENAELYIESRLPAELESNTAEYLETAQQFDQFTNNLINTVQGALNEAGVQIELPEVMLSDNMGIISTLINDGQTLAQSLTQTLVEPLATAVIRGGAFFVVFVISAIIMSFVCRVGLFINHIPLVGGLNQLLGAAVGVIEAAIIVYIITLVSVLLVNVSGNEWSWLNLEIIEQTKVFMWVTEQPLPLNINIFDSVEIN